MQPELQPRGPRFGLVAQAPATLTSSRQGWLRRPMAAGEKVRGLEVPLIQGRDIGIGAVANMPVIIPRAGAKRRRTRTGQRMSAYQFVFRIR